MLTSTVIRLRARGSGLLPRAMGEFGHAAFLAIVRQVAPDLSQALHDAGARLPYSVSPLYGGRLTGRGVQVQPDRTYWMRFTILDPGLYAVFSRYFADSSAPDVAITLGGVPFAVEELTSSAKLDPWAGYTTFAKLASSAACEPVVALQFWSLTAFSLGHGPGAAARYGILPDPVLVFDSLLRRWNRFADAPLADPNEWRQWLAEHVVVSAHRIRSESWQFRQHPQVGFVGDCTYQVVGGSAAQVRQLNALADFAFYAGVGMKTAMGMGQCRRVGRSASVLEG